MAKEIDTWKDRLAISHRKFKKEAEENIKRWRNYYRGSQWSEAASQAYRDKVVDNMVFSNIRTIMPSINFKSPRIFVSPRKKPYRTDKGMFDTMSAAVIQELLLNYYYKVLEIKREVDKCLLDALIGPWGIVQIGYTLQTEKVRSDGEKIEVSELIKEESPFVKRISPMDFRVDFEAKDSHLHDANWVAVKWVKTLDDIKSNPSYENTAKLKANVSTKTEPESSVSMMDKGVFSDPSDLERVEGWTIWDKKKEKIYTLVDNHKGFLQYKDWPLEYDGFPFETLYFNENPDELFPISDVDIYITAQDELNRIRSLQLSHIRNVASRKIVAREGAFDEEEIRKLTYGPDGTVAISKLAVDSAFAPVRDASMSQDIYLIANNLKNGIRESSSVAQYERGVAQKFDTATEPSLMAQGISIQRAERSGILEDFIKHIVSKLGKVLQQTLSEEVSVPLTNEQFGLAREFALSKIEKIAGNDGGTILLPWLSASKEDIQGDYDFNIEVGSTQPVNDQKRRQDALALYQLFQGNPYVDAYEGTREVLEAFDKKEPEKLMKKKEEVDAQMQGRAEAAQKAEQAKETLKRQTDLEKTKIKSHTNILTTMLKRGG